MKSLRLLRWSGTIFPPRTRPCLHQIHIQNQHQVRLGVSRRYQATAASPVSVSEEPEVRRPEDEYQQQDSTSEIRPARRKGSATASQNLRKFPSPPPSTAAKSSRLAALYARLELPKQLPIEILARCLIDASADTHTHFNNQRLAVLGEDLLGYFASEAILCRYPRIPTEVLFAAMSAYVGPRTLAAITREWGIDPVAAPGGEVDPGLLQFSRKEAGNAGIDGLGIQLKEMQQPEETLSATRPNPEKQVKGWRKGVSSKTVYDNAFGETIAQPPDSLPSLNNTPRLPATIPITLEAASATFIRALTGALYLTSGFSRAKTFFNAHIMSRHLDVSSLFYFSQATRDLAKLCAREGFDPPVARILSETGRQSRHPVFLVAIFSGRENLGQAAGASLDEARIRAAVAALKGWYLYSPLDVRVPSDTIGSPSKKEWEPLMVDIGEVVV